MSERSLAPTTRPDPDPPDPTTPQSSDPRYEHVTCPACGQRWQRIDWGCQQHAISCTVNPLPPQPPLAAAPKPSENDVAVTARACGVHPDVARGYLEAGGKPVTISAGDRILGPEDLRSLRTQLLQIRAQAVQVLPAYDQSRPRPSHELGCALARICERTHRAVDAIALSLGIQPRPAVTRRPVAEIEPECSRAVREFIDRLPYAGYRETADRIPGLAVRAAELLLEWADAFAFEDAEFLAEEERRQEAARDDIERSEPDYGGFSDPMAAARYYSPGVIR